jgi:hypothetical protein
MLAAYLVFFVLGLTVFLFTARLGLPIRIVIALAIIIVPSISLTVWVVRAGDEPPPGAVTVVPEPSAVPENPASEDSDLP